MRFYAIVLCTILAAAFFAGCASNTDSSASSQQSVMENSSEGSGESSGLSAGPIDSPAAELKTPGEITVYKIYQGSEIFEPYKVPVEQGEVTLLDIAAAVERQLGVKIPIKKITQQKGMVVIDIAESFIGDYKKGEVYQILTTLAATLQQNHRTFEWIQYQLDGEVGIFGEKYEIPPLKLIEGTAAEFAAIRGKVAYEGLRYHSGVENPVLDTDETGKKLINYLAMLRLIDKDISSPAELDNKNVLEVAVFATKWYSSNPDYPENYAPELKPLEAPASEAVGFFEDWFWLKEHVEQSAKLLYGDDFVIKHESFNGYLYLESLGVYTPPHRGGGYNVIPVIFGYEDLGDRYRIELAYIISGEGGYSDPDAKTDEWKPIDEKDLKDYVQTKSLHREVIVKKESGGRFVLVSHKYL